jgi:hypothetical protein
MSAVPYLPVMDLVAEHAANLAKADVDGLMFSWSTGGYPSINLEVARRIMDKKGANVQAVLDEVAREYYGERAAPFVRKAWTAFSNGFREFPYGLGLYTAPMQYGPMNLLWAKPTGYGATMVGFPYDDVNSWRGIYPAQVLAVQFVKVARGWHEGLRHLYAAVAASDGPHRKLLEEEIGLAEAAYAHFATCAYQTRFIIARDSGDSERVNEMRSVLDSEIGLSKDLYGLTKADSRIGFEASNQYYYTPLDLVEKVLNCEHLREVMNMP